MSKPYISLDIETTGLSMESDILQIAAVYDDLKSPVSELPKLNIKIKFDEFNHSEPYALMMNSKLIAEMCDKSAISSFVPAFEAVHLLEQFMFDQLKKTGDKKIILAGKNVASFDIPMIKSFITRNCPLSPVTSEQQARSFEGMTHYKTLDVGSLYFDVFKDNVSLSKINELTGRPPVSHDALDDALDVVYAVRHKLGVKYE